ncbi:MAG: hypothetical protein HRT45_00225 [Bdellovibrionales bacterium]|nr:hypothetical protein [Bdellovibrionales bacterium]
MTRQLWFRVALCTLFVFSTTTALAGGASTRLNLNGPLKPVYPDQSFCSFHESFVLSDLGLKRFEDINFELKTVSKARRAFIRNSKTGLNSMSSQQFNTELEAKLVQLESRAENAAKNVGRAFFDDITMSFQLDKLDQFLFVNTKAHEWLSYRDLYQAISATLSGSIENWITKEKANAFMSRLNEYYQTQIATSGGSASEAGQKLAKQWFEAISQTEATVIGAMIHQKRLRAKVEQTNSFRIQNAALFGGAGLLAVSLYLALAGGTAIISSPIILVGLIAATGAAGVPLIKNAVSSLGEANARSKKYGTSFSCEQAEHYKLTASKQLTEAAVGFGAGLIVGGLIALLPPVASLLLAPLMAGYIGYMAQKEFKLAYNNYYGEQGYEILISLAKGETDAERAAILRDLANKRLTDSATESTVGLITLGLFVLVVYEGIVFIVKSQNKVLNIEREKMMQFWARVQEMSAEFKAAGNNDGSRSAKLEAEELSAVLGVEGENLSALVGGDEELALEVSEYSKSLGIEQQVGEMLGSGGTDQISSTLLQNLTGQGPGSEVFYSELSYYFAKLLELSSNDAAMIAHKMIDKHLSYASEDKGNFSHAANISEEQKNEYRFLVSLFGIDKNPIVQSITKNKMEVEALIR